MLTAMLGFLAIVAFVVLFGVWAVWVSAPDDQRSVWGRRAAGAMMLWLVVSALPTLTGLLGPAGPVPPQAVMLVVLGVASWVGFSRLGGRVSVAVPLWALVGFQGFRFPLELVLHEWVEQGAAPPQMTWTGQNLDIVAGAVALVSAPIVRRWPVFAWVPTLVGAALLLNILRIVALSLPGPLQRFPEMVTLPFHFPHVWIATVCVAGAVVGHVLAIRALLGRGGEAD